MIEEVGILNFIVGLAQPVVWLTQQGKGLEPIVLGQKLYLPVDHIEDFNQ